MALAAITFKQPHLLIMDEPTNHLDMETIDALILAIQDYKGGVIVVSHDLHFLSSVRYLCVCVCVCVCVCICVCVCMCVCMYAL